MTPCWLYTGYLLPNGYGYRRIHGKTWALHRYFWTVMRGPIPAGLEIDHLCRVRHCVNPQHMELVTHRENLLRGQTSTAHYASRTTCARGHPFTSDNITMSHGYRSCLTCARERMRNRRARAK